MLLDLDGTLAPIVPHPEDVAIPAAIRASVVDLRDRFALVAVVSGRRIEELLHIVAIDGLAYSGNHGNEIMRADGSEIAVAHEARSGQALRALVAQFPQERVTPWGVWLEDKGWTITFHYRESPDPDRSRQALDAHIAPAAAAAGLDVEPGRMSLEVHPSSAVTKGSATHALLGGRPDVRRAVSLGDDRTDVQVWRALRERRKAGSLTDALAVAIVSDETPGVVLDEADLRVEGVAGTEAVLAELARGQAA